MPKNPQCLWSPLLVLLWFVCPIQAQEYPEASLDQATFETMCSLKIERYEGLDEASLQAEYQWALEMAELSLQNLEKLCRRNQNICGLAIEFQRHAGRTARYRGFGEQAIADYEKALDYVYESIVYLTDPRFVIGDSPPEVVTASYEDLILRDIADTYLLIGANESAADMSNLVIERSRESGDKHGGRPPELNRLAQIAQRQGRFAESVRLQQQAIRAEQNLVSAYLAGHHELQHIEPNQAWTDVVRHPDVQRIMGEPDYDDQALTSGLRNSFCQLARALRLNGQLGDAEYALTTADLTPWEQDGTYRQRLGLYVDHEWAFLALDQGKPEEALEQGQACLDKYKMMPPHERVELLDLISRAMEQLGDLQRAFDKLKEAIEIIETKRANLITDEYKQSFVAGYAPLYRRALELVIQLNKDSDEAIEATFEWSERIKARVMLDCVNRYDKRMERAVALGDTQAMKGIQDLTKKVVSVDELRRSPWWLANTALLEYTYLSKGSGGNTQISGNAYLWMITSGGVSFHRLNTSGDQIDANCETLAKALQRGNRRDDKWVEPAAKLYDQTIAPIADRLKGIKQLVIVGDGKLRTIPFEVFITTRNAHAKRYIKHHLLIEDFTISYAPSATLLDAISKKSRPDSWDYSLWAFASTKFKPDKQSPLAAEQQPSSDYKTIMRSARSLVLDDLPFTGKEVEEVAKCFRDGKVRTFVDQPQMKSTLMEASRDETLKSVRFLHFATHAVVDADRPYLSGLVLSPPFPIAEKVKERSDEIHLRKIEASKNQKDEKEKPNKPLERLLKRKTAPKNRPELLTLSELADLNLRSELVVLSACESIGRQAMDGDWINGLTRSLLVAGSSGVICTTWDTSDLVTAGVIPAIYDTMLNDQSAGSHIDVPRALQQFKTAMLTSPKHGHPSCWSPFIYHGRVSSAGGE